MTFVWLIYEFLKTGLFSIGGGLATMPFLYAMADKYPWFDRALLVDMIAISESTPGPIGINMATFAGFVAGGVAGGVLASLALILPSIAILSAVVRVLDRFRESRLVKNAFYGLRPAVTALITSAGLGIAAITIITPFESIRPLSDGLSISVYTGVVNEILLFVASIKWKALLLFMLLFAALRLHKKTQPVLLIATAAVVGILFRM